MNRWLALSLTSLLLACGPSQPAQDPGQNAYPGVNPPPPRRGGEYQVPVVLQLAQGQVNPATGETDLVATIDVLDAIAYPVMLTVALPPGAQLTMGHTQEQLALTQPGRLQRVFRVRALAPLTVDAPVHVVLEGHTQAAGIRADRQFPPRNEYAPGPNPNGPRPPGGRPPGTR